MPSRHPPATPSSPRAPRLASCLVAVCGVLIGARVLWMVGEGIQEGGMYVTCKRVLSCWVSIAENPVAFWGTATLLSGLGITFLVYGVIRIYEFLKLPEKP